MGEVLNLGAAAKGVAAPANASRAFAAALSRADGRIEAGKIPAELVPLGFAAALERRREVLAPAQRAASRRELGAILASLEGMVGRKNDNATEALFAIERDLADLAGPPLWALERAAQEFRQGVIGEGRFRPTVGEVRRRAMALAAPYAAEAAAIERVLAAEVRAPLSAEERARVAAEMRRLRAGAFAAGPTIAGESAEPGPAPGARAPLPQAGEGKGAAG